MDSYALLDFGDGRKLERFGQVVLDRASPAAIGTDRAESDWSGADLRLDDEGKVLSGKTIRDDWFVELVGI